MYGLLSGLPNIFILRYGAVLRFTFRRAVFRLAKVVKMPSAEKSLFSGKLSSMSLGKIKPRKFSG